MTSHIVTARLPRSALIAPSAKTALSARSPGLRARDACERTVSLAPDALAHVDAADPRTVRFLETRNAGAPVGHEVVHAKEVRAVALNQRGSLPDRRVAFADVDGELFVSKVAERGGTRKLCDACDSHRWSETHSVLACVSSDGKLRVWSYPDAAYVDRDLVGLTTRVVETNWLETVRAAARQTRARGLPRTSRGHGRLVR